jgi:hypothetical protein
MIHALAAIMAVQGAAAAPPPAAASVAFCFVRDAPHHDFLTPPAPAGTDLAAKMKEWLAATLPDLAPERLERDVQCDPDLPRSLYDGWMGWTKLSGGDVFSEPFKWPADWYLRHPPARKPKPRH